MHRHIVYPYEGVQDVDILLTNKHAMIGLGYALQAILGTATLADGLACTPTGPATMTVNVSGGSIYSLAAIDATAYGSLAADTADQIVKQGIVLATTNFACPAPATVGQSVVYLVQAAYADQDGGSANEPFVNATTGVPYSSTVYSERQGLCVLALKTGIAAATGTQATPAPDAGYSALWAITVANGQTTITSSSIAAAPGAPFIGTKLTGRLNPTSNLSDVASASTSLANLGGLAISAARTKLTSGTANFYVNGSGSDSTGNGSSAAPWASVQHAMNVLASNYDCVGLNPTINVGGGGYAGVLISTPILGGTPILNGTGASSTTLQYVDVLAAATVQVQNMTLANPFGTSLQADQKGRAFIGPGVAFGTCPSNAHMAMTNGGTIIANNNYQITGSASAHLLLSDCGQFNASTAISVSVVSAVSIATFAVAQSLSDLDAGQLSFTGAAVTGVRYLVSGNSIINTNGGGANFFPGTSAGSATSGGQYV